MLLEKIMSFEDVLNQPIEENKVEEQAYSDEEKEQMQAAEYEKQFYHILNQNYDGIF